MLNTPTACLRVTFTEKRLQTLALTGHQHNQQSVPRVLDFDLHGGVDEASDSDTHVTRVRRVINARHILGIKIHNKIS